MEGVAVCVFEYMCLILQLVQFIIGREQFREETGEKRQSVDQSRDGTEVQCWFM